MKRPISVLLDLVMILHTAAYALGAVGFFLESVSGVQFNFASHLTFFAAWSLIFLVHERVHHFAKMQQARKGMVPAADERHAYRDGFNDAVRMLREGQEIPNRLTLNEDGELIEDVEAKKRKYR